MNTDKNLVYWEKEQFVKMLSKSLSEQEIVEKIEYKRIKDKYSEFVKITYPGDACEFIDVTGNSCKAIFLDIAREINHQPPIGQIIDMRHKELVIGWWNESE